MVKIRIEDKILEHLEGDLQERALSVAAYLNANDMTPHEWFGSDFWKVPYKDYYLCGIVVQKDCLRFWFWKGVYAGSYDATFIKATHDNVRPCITCGGECKGIDIVVFGKGFENTCFQFPIQFENPDEETMEHIKVLMEYCKGIVPPEDAWHARIA